MPAMTLTSRRRISVGLPSGLARGERRFPLTPEGAMMLVEKGIAVVMEQGAGEPIHYSDEAYRRAGVHIDDRAETLKCDIIISLAALSSAEISQMKRGAMLLTLTQAVVHGPKTSAKALLNASVLTLGLEKMADENGNRRVADVLHEIDGCASLSIASAMLTDPVHGKGILLGGVTGIVPCEVTVIGSGMGAIAAAHCALGMGATVRIFDNDLYSLRQAGRVLNHRAIGSALHPHVLEGALRSADVVIATPMADKNFAVGSEMVETMKKRALVFDLNPVPGQAFPSLPTFNLGEVADRQRAVTSDRACYYNVGCQVPRTAAMALTNVLTQLADRLLELASEASVEQAVLLSEGTRSAVLTIFGKATDADVAAMADAKAVDPNLFTTLS